MEKFSIIVCTINRANLLDKGLYTLTHQNYLSDSYEIIIIDDGSKDNTKQIVEKHKRVFPYIKYEALTNKEEYTSPARARNIGLRKASYKICCFTDPEILVPSNMLKIHNVIHEEKKKCIVCTRPVLMTEEETKKLNQIYSSGMSITELDNLIPSLTDKKIHKLETQKQWKDNHFSSFKKERAFKIKCVNENFDKWGFEGIDFVERMIKSGLELINVDKVYHMWHDAPRNMEIANEQRLKYGVENCGKS